MIAVTAPLLWHQIFETAALMIGARYYLMLKRRAARRGCWRPATTQSSSAALPGSDR